MLHPVDLAVGVAIVGYGVWKRFQPRRPKTIDIDVPYLLNIPPEVRLLVYDFVFDDADDRVPLDFLQPLLTCKQVHDEAFPLAFSRSRFLFPVRTIEPPFFSPRILKLPAAKLSRVRHIEIAWHCHIHDPNTFDAFFFQLAHGPLCLDELTFTIKLRQCLNVFRLKWAAVHPQPRDFAKYITQNLLLMDNVQKVVFPNPGIEIKRNYQLLFAPNKPCLRLGGTEDAPTVEMAPKQLGGWHYSVVREGKNMKSWRLELTQPRPEDKSTDHMLCEA
ncbi:hypothetical protein EJ04DRAFT_91704 [Polyplosphaeria fusca]|uniref:Uncharacterized protein n=1 Tax=Polyplosphaeria fusca TaxID=682080 RepID=A0A9P4QN00_9PLEO|nr:hypothetical protein EJ04DRAFT_91704 [Polyplosphaeria fusca]